MATKAHVQENTVAERRLRPIYEWLDSGNNKKALQECDKVLKKTPNLLCAKALKALSILRMGREAECTNILDAVILETPADDSTLQALTLCYRELQQQEKICGLYETAIKLDPTNEEFHTHLFMSYVRLGDFKLQQQSAMNLFKFKPKNPYYCWGVMSVVHQATRGEGMKDLKKRQVLLSLAERMMNKLITENKLEAEQELQLYLMVLELQDKFEEALQVLNDPLGAKLVCATPDTYKLPYLIKLKRWSEINMLCKSMLMESVDRWDIWKQYMMSVFELASGEVQINNHVENHTNGEHDFENVDDTPERAHEFICRLVENGTDNGYLLRGPYLARFELCSRLIKQGIDSTELLGETIELFIEYFRKFGHKPCCVSDLRVYLYLLDGEKKLELSNRLIKDVGISSTSVPQSEQQMQRHLCSLQLSRLCGSHRNLSADHLASLVTAFSLHYQHGHQTYGSNLLFTDQGPSDCYAILAAHILYDLAQLTRSSKPIITALVLLQSLLKNSPCSFNAKLLCVRLYHTIGAGLGAQKIYESLDIKHLQIDSMGYMHCARLPTTGLIFLTTNLLDSTYKFFSSNYKDSADHLTFCYKYGSFIKLDDFMDFRERLNNSYHYAAVAIDRIIFNMIQYCNSTENIFQFINLPKDNNIDWDKLRDNHDLSVYVVWDPERAEGPLEYYKDVKELLEQNVQFLKLRIQVLWALHAAMNVIKSTDDTREKSIFTLKNILKDWQDLHHQINSAKSVPVTQHIVTLPLPSRLHLHLKSPYLDILGDFFTLVIEIVTENPTQCNTVVENLNKKIEEMLERTSIDIENQNTSEDCLWERRNVMETIVNTVEIMCISCILCLLCSNFIKLTQGKKSKKKIDLGTRSILIEVSGIIKKAINKLDKCLESWKSSTEYDLSERLALLNIGANNQNSVLEDIKNSHITAVKELRTVLKVKSRLLNSVSG